MSTPQNIAAIAAKHARGKTLTAKDKASLEAWKASGTSGTKPPAKVVSGTELALLLGITDVRVQQLAKQGTIIKVSRGKYELWSSVKTYIKYLRDRAYGKKEEDVGADSESLQRERVRLTRAKADAAEIEAGLMSGKVHDSAVIKAIWADMIGNAKARITALPVKCAGDVRDLVAQHAPPEVVARIDLVAVRETLTDSCREALLELADYDASKLVANFVERNRGNVDAAPEGDDEPVGRRTPAP